MPVKKKDEQLPPLTTASEGAIAGAGATTPSPDGTVTALQDLTGAIKVLTEEVAKLKENQNDLEEWIQAKLKAGRF